ncbi:tol-pal system protein YbgF [Neptuniibacter marinus]|uniref:tol-pal system protein YbgF n=1 Tax=Neptuniibacter marinus TaxID=1806670 RepID=UPI003B5ACF6A
MTSKYTVYTSTLALFLSASAVAEEVPVIELGVDSGQSSSQTATYTPQTSSGSELVLIVQQLQDEVRSLRGQLEQQDYRLKQMERQQLDRYRDLDRRISSIPTTSAPSTPVSTDLNNAEPTSTVTQSQPELVQSDAAPSDAKAYREAFGLVRERNFPKAAEAFTAFIKDYPQSERLANAYYWLGEVNLAEQKPELARESFMQVVTRFADHRKAPDAAYKLGIVYDQLGDSAKSTEYLDLVITKYPDSSAVRLAEEFKRLQ